MHERRHETLLQLWEYIHRKRDKLLRSFRSVEAEETSNQSGTQHKRFVTTNHSDEESSDEEETQVNRHRYRNRVTTLGWRNVMRTILDMDSVPWLLLRPYIVNVSEDGYIDYQRLLARHEVRLNAQLIESWDQILIDEFCRRIYSKSKELITVFSYFFFSPFSNDPS